jgi:hypothetical protein
MPKSLTKVYDLKEDTGLIYTYQSYTREGRCGFVPEHGLFGSEEWWEAIKSGALPAHTLEGPILRADTLQTSGMLEQDYLELEIADPDSPGLSWNLFDDQTDRSRFVVGQQARLTYVLQRGQSTLSSGPEKIMLEVWLDLNDRA